MIQMPAIIFEALRIQLRYKKPSFEAGISLPQYRLRRLTPISWPERVWQVDGQFFFSQEGPRSAFCLQPMCLLSGLDIGCLNRCLCVSGGSKVGGYCHIVVEGHK